MTGVQTCALPIYAKCFFGIDPENKRNEIGNGIDKRIGKTNMVEVEN